MSESAKSNVLVAMPTRGDPKLLALAQAQDLATRNGCQITVIQGEPCTLVRNKIALTIKANPLYTHVLMIDDDTVVLTRDLLPRLLALDADLATACVPFAAGENGQTIVAVRRTNSEEWEPCWPLGEPFPCHHVGTACLLIKRRVFDIIKFPYFQYRQNTQGRMETEDVVFSSFCREAGLSIMCDPACICDHIKTIDLLYYAPPVPQEYKDLWSDTHKYITGSDGRDALGAAAVGEDGTPQPVGPC